MINSNPDTDEHDSHDSIYAFVDTMFFLKLQSMNTMKIISLAIFVTVADIGFVKILKVFASPMIRSIFRSFITIHSINVLKKRYDVNSNIIGANKSCGHELKEKYV